MVLHRLLCCQRRALALAVVLAASLAACSGNNATPADSGGHPDAGTPDAMVIVPDAGFCPGKFTYQVGVLGWKTMLGVVGSTVTEVGNPSNATTAAPNGRAILCLPANADSTVEIAHPDADPKNNIPAYITRLNAVSIASETIRAMYAPAAVGRLITPADADDLFTNQLMLTRDPSKAQVLVDVRSYPANKGLTGATVSLGSTSSDGAFAEDASGNYQSGDSVGGGSRVLFANVDPSGGSVPVTVTAPSGFGGSCVGPTSIPVVAGELSYALFACQ